MNTVKTDRRKQVNVWMDTILKQLDDSKDIQDNLQAKLMPICTNLSTPKSISEEPEEELVPLAYELKIISQRLNDINDSYKYTIKNIEIGE